MDAVEFLKAAERRSRSNPDYYGEFINLHDNDWVALVAQVEQWSKEHPPKTRQSEFMKMFPCVKTDPNGVIHICKNRVNSQEQCGKAVSCSDCRRDYWLQDMEEP